MNNLNELIQAQAEEKLKAEIQEYLLKFRDHKFFQAIDEVMVWILRSEGDNTETMNRFLWNAEQEAGKMIKEKFLSSYVEEEARAFMRKVEQGIAPVKIHKNRI